MDQRRLLLLSNSTNFGEAYLEYPKKSIFDFLGKDIKNVLFIPYAGVGFSYDDYSQKVAAPFKELGYELQGIHTFPDAELAVQNAEAIAIGGGNTFELLNQLYSNDLINQIREKVAQGMPFMGWSAGSNVAGPSIKTTNDMPIVEPQSFTALNLVPFQINPHYTEERLPNHGGETRKDRINEFIAINKNINVVGIPEGNILRIEGDECQLIGSDFVKIFNSEKEIQELNSTDNLKFLTKN